MKILKERSGPSNHGNYPPIPRAARLINTLIAVVLCGLSIYHFTQPNEAWRSGITELVGALLLLAAAYCVSHKKAIVINLVAASGISVLGIRHLIHGEGWRAGITELLFVVLLVVAASMIYRDREKQNQSYKRKNQSIIHN